MTATAAVLWLASCQPDSITGARDQLERGGSRTLELTFPLLFDTFTVGQFLAEGDTVTTPNGSLGIRVDSQSLAIGIGEKLSFNNITLDPYNFSYDQMLKTAEDSTSLELSISAGSLSNHVDTVYFDTPEGSRVTSAEVASGWIIRAISNATNCTTKIGTDITDATGDTVVAFPSRIMTTGSAEIDSVSAADTRVSEFVVMPEPSVSVTDCSGSPATGTVQVTLTYRPMTLASVELTNVSESFNEGYAPGIDDRLNMIDTVTMSDGNFDITIGSKLPIPLTLDITLDGVLIDGVPLQHQFLVPAAPGDGSTVSSELTVDLLGARIVPDDVFANVTGVATADNITITSAISSSTVSIDIVSSFTPNYLVGLLDPDLTPELVSLVDTEKMIDAGSVDFDDFEDAVRGVTLNEASLTFMVANGLQTMIRLDTLQIGIARASAGGKADRDSFGEVIFEEDSIGNAILLTLADSDESSITLPRGDSVNVTLQAAPLADRMVSLLLDDVDVALVGYGTVRIGDGQQARVNATDSVTIDFDMVVGLDLLLPDSGVVFEVTRNVEAAGVDSIDAADLADRILEARAIAEVVNGIPFEIDVEVAVAEDNLGDTTSVFDVAGHIALPSVGLSPAAVDPTTGRTTATTTDSVETYMTGDQTLLLLGDSATVTVKVRIKAPLASDGRATVRSADGVIVRALARLRARAGGEN